MLTQSRRYGVSFTNARLTEQLYWWNFWSVGSKEVAQMPLSGTSLLRPIEAAYYSGDCKLKDRLCNKPYCILKNKIVN